jgi:hypothetical protein
LDSNEVTQMVAVLLVAVLILIFAFVVYLRGKKDRRGRLARLGEEEEDIVYLSKYGFVLPRATGQSITHISAEVENLTEKSLQVVIKPGTCFLSSGSHQNMVTCQRHTFRLFQGETKRVSVPAACINAGKPIPAQKDRFRGVARVSDNLTRFLERASAEDAMVIQAGVWALTDNYSGTDVQRRLIARTSRGESCPAVSAAQVAKARQILDELQVPNRL